MEVTPIIFERNLRTVCGTWTIDEYIAYLKTTNLSQKECKKAIKNFKEGEEMLRDMCEAECYGCSYDLLKCMSISSCRSIVENHNGLQGGDGNKINTLTQDIGALKIEKTNKSPLKRKDATSGSVVLVEEAKKKKDKQEKKAQDIIDKASGTFITSKKKKKVKLYWKGQYCPICKERFTVWKKENKDERVVRAHPNLKKGDEHQCYFHKKCLMEWLKDKEGEKRTCPKCGELSQYHPDKMKKNVAGIVKKISTIYDCPEWNDDMKCVQDFDYEGGDNPDSIKCIPEQEVLGYGKHELSDQHCYRQNKLKEWVDSGKSYSPVLGSSHPFSNDDLELIKGNMLEQEQNVILSMVNNVLGRFLSGIEEWKVNTKNKDRMASSDLKMQAAKATAGATGGMMAAYLGFGFATGGAGLAIGAVAGAAASIGWLRNKVTTAGIDLGIWIVKDPKTAMMFMMVVKMGLKSMCKEMAKALQRQTFERKSTSGYYADKASGVLSIIGEAGEISVGGIMRGCLNGEKWKALWANGGDFAASCVASVVPGGTLVKGAASFVVGGIVGAAEEATKTGIELAAYQQDISKGTELVIEILQMVLNPVKCMQQHGIVKYTSCGQLQLDERACKGAPECKFVPGGVSQVSRCEEQPCEDRESKDLCERGGKCVFQANKCRAAGYTEGWFS